MRSFNQFRSPLRAKFFGLFLNLGNKGIHFLVVEPVIFHMFLSVIFHIRILTMAGRMIVDGHETDRGMVDHVTK